MIKYFIEFNTKEDLSNEYIKLIKNNIYETLHYNDEDIFFINRIIKIKKIKKCDFSKELILLDYNDNRKKYLDELENKGIKIKNLFFNYEKAFNKD